MDEEEELPPVPDEQNEPELPTDPVDETDGWIDEAAQVEANAKAYADEQIPLVAGRLVPRNEDRAPELADGEDLPAGTGWNEYDPTTGDLVQMWRWDGAAWIALDMSPEMIPVLDIGSATVGDLTGARINVQDGPIIAGAPGGARVEVTADGLHAYDASNTETATIQGDGGEFVGGSFRTSDALPGQVLFSDDAFISSGTGLPGRPGLRFTPPDMTGIDIPPGIGHDTNGGVRLDGGKAVTGERSVITSRPTASLMRTYQSNGQIGGSVQASPELSLMRTYQSNGHLGGEMWTSPESSLMRTYRPDGQTGGAIRTNPESSIMRTYRPDGGEGGLVQTSPADSRVRTYSGNGSESGWVQARPQDAELAYVAPNNTYFSRIKADAAEAFIFTRAGGATRYLSIDANGVWVKTNKSGTEQAYNLEETAQDSGWQAITLASGVNGGGYPSWRNKGGMIYFRGTTTSAWTQGWNTVATDLPAEMRPAVRVQQVAPSSSEVGLVWRMGADGHLEFYKPSNGTRTGELSGLFYPIG